MLLSRLLLLLAVYQYGGTFIGAIVCSDGIVVAADSRSTFMTGQGEAFAFVDGMPKIYVDRGAAVALSGMSSLDGELFSSFVNRNRFLLARPVNEILFGFLLYVPFTNSTGIAMISAGFLDGKPMICAKSPIADQGCSNSGYFASKPSPLLRETLTSLNRKATMDEGVAALKAAIEASAQTDVTVGGPVSIVKLTSDGPPQWVGAVLSDGGLNQICDLVRERRSDIMPLGTRQELDLHLSAACPK
ncbi:MAG TPA: hypothetical protein VGK48_18620 [Terriglobia bacterium]|jgi:20S proteasome alpha/beta subunit